MPLTEKGRKIMAAMDKRYPTKKKAKRVFYGAENAGTITGVHAGGKKKGKKKRRAGSNPMKAIAMGMK